MSFAKNEREQCVSTWTCPTENELFRCQFVLGHDGKHFNRGTEEEPCAVSWADRADNVSRVSKFVQ